MMFETKECRSTTSTIHTPRSTIFFNSSDFEITTQINGWGRDQTQLYVCVPDHIPDNRAQLCKLKF